MQLLKIKDNTQEKSELFLNIPDLIKQIANKTLKQLEKEGVFVFPETIENSEDLDENQMIIQRINDTYQTGNIMGFLGYSDERLIIQSRFSGEEKDFFLQYLLNRVFDFPNMVDLPADSNQDNKLFNYFLFLFPVYLKRAMRKGVFKRYTQNKYNDDNIKGTIDIAKHIELNTPFTGKIAYSKREFSYDNNLMELVRHTVEFIKRKPYGGQILNKAKDDVKRVIEATPQYNQNDRKKIIELNTKYTVRHAYYREYSALQKLCLLILRYQNHALGSGTKQIYGILFDGAWLWEEYINSLISKWFYHPMNKKGEGAQRLFSGNNGLIYPDFISRNDSPRIIADAKYKRINNIGNKDYLQVLAYMFRFDAKEGYYFYPEPAETDDLKFQLNQGSTYESNVMPRGDVSITKHGMRIPSDVSDYDGFIVEMKKNETRFLKFLQNMYA